MTLSIKWWTRTALSRDGWLLISDRSQQSLSETEFEAPEQFSGTARWVCLKWKTLRMVHSLLHRHLPMQPPKMVRLPLLAAETLLRRSKKRASAIKYPTFQPAVVRALNISKAKSCPAWRR